MSGGRLGAPGHARRGLRAVALAAGGLAGALAAVWWLTRPPAAAVAVAPPAESPSAAPAGWPSALIEVVAAGFAAPARGDPLLDAIPPESQAVVLEVNALVHSPLGRLTLECLDRKDREVLDRLARAGVDPRVDVDRVALAWDGESLDRVLVAATGRLARADLPALARALLEGERASAPVPHGGDAVTVEDRFCFIGCHPVTLALWRDRTLVLGHPERTRASLDRLQGRPDRAFAFPPGLEGAELSAVMSAGDVADWLNIREAALKEWLSALETRAEVRVDAARDVRAEARVTVEDPAAADDLAALFAAAVAAGRAAAEQAGDWKRAELLRGVTVSRGVGSFTLRLELTLDALERQLAGCPGKRGRASP